MLPLLRQQILRWLESFVICVLRRHLRAPYELCSRKIPMLFCYSSCSRKPQSALYEAEGAGVRKGLPGILVPMRAPRVIRLQDCLGWTIQGPECHAFVIRVPPAVLVDE